MTECSRCGDCCEQIYLGFDLDAPIPEDRLDDERSRVDCDFMRAHWHPSAEQPRDGHTAYTCDVFDAETRLCTAHDKRPPVCRDYPWYGKEPDAAFEQRLPPRCEFRLDIGLKPERWERPARVG